MTMAPNTSAAIMIGAMSSTVSGPLFQVFDELALVMAVLGGLGGLCRGVAVVGTPVRETLRSVFLGALLAFGVGVFSPSIVSRLIGVDVSGIADALPLLAASSFLIGLLQDVFISWLRKESE